MLLFAALAAQAQPLQAHVVPRPPDSLGQGGHEASAAGALRSVVVQTRGEIGAGEERPPALALPPDSARAFHEGRFYAGLGIAGGLNAAGIVALSRLWYTGDRVPFHWFSDSAPLAYARPHPPWLDDWYTDVQMDKVGHLVATWHLTKIAGAYARWAGLSDRQAGAAGALTAAAFQAQIEFFDGFDPAYGASRMDLAANVAGAVVGGLQVAYPHQTDWFAAKWSYHPSRNYKPHLTPAPPLTYVGNGLKDYEGASFWLVVRPDRLGAPAWWPRWLAVSAGYGADGLTGKAPACCAANPEERREVYLSLDLDVLRAERHRLPRRLRPVADVLGFVRIPMPAYKFGGRGRSWYWLYY